MAISIIGYTKKMIGASGGSTDAMDTTGADEIFAFVTYLAGSTGTMADSKSNTPQTDVMPSTYGGSHTTKCYYFKNPTVGSGHTFGFTGSALYASIIVIAIGGSLGANVDQQAQNNANATSVQAGSITPSVDGSIVLSGLGTGSTGTHSIDGGFTKVDEEAYSAGVNFGTALGYLIQTTKTAANPAWSRSGSGLLTAINASFKPYVSDTNPPTNCVLGTPTALSATSARFPISTLSTDADSGMQKYYFEFDTVDTFDSPNLIQTYHNATTSPFDKTGLTAGRRWYARAKGVDNATPTPNLSASFSATVHVDLPPTINTNSPLNSAIIGTAFSQTLSKTGGTGTWSIQSGAPSGFAINATTGEITWDDPTPLGVTEDIVTRFTVTSSGLYAEVSYSIEVTDADFEPFELLDHVKMLNLNSLGWSAPLIEANFGGGYGAGIIANQDYGLHRWTIASEFLPDHSYEIDALIDSETITQKYFTYVFEFFKRHTLRGNKPFIIKEHRTGNYYLVRFAMGGAIDFGRLTAKFFTSEGIQVTEARTTLEGFTFAEDGSVTKT